MTMADPDTNGKYILYHYNPSLAAATLFITLFALSTVAHGTQLLLKRTWYFIPLVIGGLFETIGYVGRVISAKQSPDWSVPPYVMQSLLILLAPALFAASIYMVLSRIISLTGGEVHSVIRVSWLTKIFVTGDVLSFLAQSAGGGMIAKAKTQSDLNLGQYVIMGGLGIQILFFQIFVITTGIFHYRIFRFPTQCSRALRIPWQRYLMVLYASSALILVRSMFRIVEYGIGQDGILLSYEYYLYIFDACLMFFSMALFNIWHPSKIICKAHGDSSSNEPVVETLDCEMDDIAKHKRLYNSGK